MLLVRICWGPTRGRFAGSGGFGFRILDFEFVWDFDIGISNFPFWLRPQAALRFRYWDFEFSVWWRPPVASDCSIHRVHMSTLSKLRP